MVKECPFRVETTYEAVGNTGMGYPSTWRQHQEFALCDKESCPAYVASPNGKTRYCLRLLTSVEEMLVRCP